MKVTDPVCGMTIEQKDAAATVQREGKTYYFCSESCRAAFAKQPERYVKQDRACAKRARRTGCGMPQVRRVNLADPSDAIAFAAVLLARLAIPLFIPRFPLPAILARSRRGAIPTT